MKNLFNFISTKKILIAVLVLIPMVGMGQKKKSKRKKTTPEMNIVINDSDSFGTEAHPFDSKTSEMNYENRLEVMISRYGKNKGRMIADGKVWASISFEMATDSWGAPEQIQRSEILNGSTQKWLYPDGRYLFFKNGRLQSWKQ